jgi:hypothetical protein
MNDVSNVWMRIGGAFPAGHLDALITLIETEGCGPRYEGDIPMSQAGIREYVEESMHRDSTLYLESSDIYGGRFYALEDQLSAWHVAWAAGWEYAGAYNAGNTAYDPATHKFSGREKLDADGVVASLNEIRRHHEAGTIDVLLAEMEACSGDWLPPFRIEK